jgi:L-aspartate oxidase
MKEAKSMNLPEGAELIVVGSGVAGLTAALAAADQGARVCLVTAGELLSGSSWWAQGGIAAAIGRGDRPAFHAADTLAVGADLNDRRAVGVLVREGRRAVNGLLHSGMPFEGGPDEPDLGLEAGHGHRRIVHAGGGATGEMVSAALLARVMDHARITLAPNTPVDALLQEDGRVVGVASGPRTFRGRAVVLTTGGYAGLWGRSTNPAGNRGIGLTLAWQAGATLADLEFVQFHPTALAVAGAPAYLLSEALRGEGALLVDADGRQVVNPLLARDVVARTIARHLQHAGPVYLTMRHLDAGFVAGHFPSIARYLRTWGLDLAHDYLPVAPAAHYCMGGVRTDTAGRTDVPGLYVAGEAACTGAQGANRLASNSLLECLVFGQRAALAALADPPTRRAHWAAGPLPAVSAASTGRVEPPPGRRTEPLTLGALLDRDLGVERDGARLQGLLASLPAISAEAPATDELLASLAARAALLRVESRGAHYRTDAPVSSPAWQGRILWRRAVPPQFEEVSGVNH